MRTFVIMFEAPFPTGDEARRYARQIAERVNGKLRVVAMDELSAVEAVEVCSAPPADPRYITPTVLGPDYDTVVGYIAKHDPQRFEFMDDHPDATLRDGWWLRGACLKRNIKPIVVEAPPFLKEHDIATVNAYPVSLLRERFGV